jgi:hypothetical protein
VIIAEGNGENAHRCLASSDGDIRANVSWGEEALAIGLLNLARFL